MRDSTKGSVAVAVTYVCWGTLAIFWDLLGDVSSLYILASRIIWSAVFLAVYLAFRGELGSSLRVLKDKKTFGLSFLCGVLITVNWGVYIYAIGIGHLLDASLGYFLEPVLVAAIGLLVFKEKPGVLEKATFFFSVAGLVYIIAATKTFPTIALLIAGSFAVYGALKKNADLPPEVSLFTETLLMAPFALSFTAYSEITGTGAIGILSGWRWFLLHAAGIVTSIPLLLFNYGVKKIPYYLAGILMYINPTLQFLLGLLIFKEELDMHRLIAFIIIWTGVLFTVYDKLRIMKNEGNLK